MVNVAGGLSGTLALARGDADWTDRLPMDANAVFASFAAVPLSLPAIALFNEAMRRLAQTMPEAAEAAAGISPATFLIANLVSAVLCWAASLLVLAQLAQRSGAGWRVSPLIVGYNWSRLLLNLVAGLGAAVAVLTGAGPVVALVALVVLGLTVWLDVAVIRHALGLPVGRALGAFAMVVLARGVATATVDLAARLFV